MVHVLPLVTGRVPFSAAIASSLCLPPSSIALVIHLNVCTAPVYNAGLGRLCDRPIERPVCAPICLLNQVGKNFDSVFKLLVELRCSSGTWVDAALGFGCVVFKLFFFFLKYLGIPSMSPLFTFPPFWLVWLSSRDLWSGAGIE